MPYLNCYEIKVIKGIQILIFLQESQTNMINFDLNMHQILLKVAMQEKYTFPITEDFVISIARTHYYVNYLFQLN